MNTKDLQYFYALSQLQSFTKVAKRFHISQPSVSYALRRLEEQFGCDLVVKDPSHRTFALTPQGKILANHCKEILLELNRLQKDMKRSFQQETRLGFPPIISGYILDLLLTRKEDVTFLSALRTIYGGSVELLHLLVEGELDMSLIGSLESLHHPKLVTKELVTKSFYFVLSEKHPLAKQEALSFEEVLEEPFILLDDRHVHHQAFHIMNDKYHEAAQVLVTLDDVFMLGQMVNENLGIAFLTDIAFPKNFKGLVKIPLKDDHMAFHVSYAYPKAALLSPEAEKLVSLLDVLTHE
ncbi:LysR family transcriptional regulator [Streptococcus ratti]|nr:LysR family transcriptional regulator [Streptococcus ratti]EMP71827.1 putative transcriptional regulator [Streptococcus ratti FA-1 = DSM 20564]QEY07424.1 LysR family transcriptional regulator [Streptococcus ratti]VEI59875.1 transcriptional regulator [Streptococcus mutans]